MLRRYALFMHQAVDGRFLDSSRHVLLLSTVAERPLRWTQ